MRRHGIATAAVGFAPGDHLCWSFAGHADFRRHALEFLAEGRRLGQCLLYTADRPRAALLADVVDGLPGAERLLDSGGLRVAPLAEAYAADADPAEQAATFATLGEEAAAAGYTGLRVASDVTPLVADPGSRQAYLSYEPFVDRTIRDARLTGMCGYDVARLGREVERELASLHPHRPAGSTDFALFNGDTGLLLVGEVDAALDPLFDAAVGRVIDPLVGRTVDVDCSDLEYLDSRGLQALDAAAAAAGVVVHLRRPPRSSERLVELLDPVAVAVGAHR